MSVTIEERLPALYDSARGGSAAPEEVYRRLQFFSRVMRQAGALEGEVPRLMWFGEGGAINSVNIGATPVIIGRAADCAVVLAGARVSRHQCVVRETAGGRGGVEVEDLQSSNGTRVNGVALGVGARELRDGDVIEIGGVALAVVKGKGEG